MVISLWNSAMWPMMGMDASCVQPTGLRGSPRVDENDGLTQLTKHDRTGDACKPGENWTKLCLNLGLRTTLQRREAGQWSH
jgi:hypothetical protein